MKEKQFSTGEAAKISGLTIRTLQHYDNIGVLPASGRTEGGRRYYTEDDLIKLEHIVFYRGLGFSLEQIKEKIPNITAEKKATELLSSQKIMLYNQIDSIQNSIAALEASQEIIEAGKIALGITCYIYAVFRKSRYFYVGRLRIFRYSNESFFRTF